MAGLVFYERAQPREKYQFVIVVDDYAEIEKDFRWRCASFEEKAYFPTAKHHLVRIERKAKLLASDDLSTSDIEPIFSQRAARALKTLFEANGKLVSISVLNGDEVFAFVPQPVDAIDHETAGWKPGSVDMIKIWPIKANMLAGVDIFINSGSYRAVGYSQRFVDAWRAAGLRGMDFKQRFPGVSGTVF